MNFVSKYVLQFSHIGIEINLLPLLLFTKLVYVYEATGFTAIFRVNETFGI